ncbi:hypothetical protein [Streptomyces turgidiscabies]|uniref:Lipoprotein n=1 Tax=Streptomyces turgidiscabies TaxID=85558 RepID=A0ABU0RGZ6_9ACTN|nr:hypothetical protein [Streptomyces turgidiscabies]MDQ0930255.1 hypothetical protein [Streptomyces turgidiscabies]
MNRRSLPAGIAITAATTLMLTACGVSNEESSKDPSTKEIQTAISTEMHAAIKAATPKAVYPKDEFGSASGAECSGRQSSVRIAGWDPEETQSNDDLLRKSTAYLEKQGWEITPLSADSEDQAARVTKSGATEGLLTASNQGLTFEGDTACAKS